MSKGSRKRPCLVPRWLYEARHDLAYGLITPKGYIKILKEHENENNKA